MRVGHVVVGCCLHLASALVIGFRRKRAAILVPPRREGSATEEASPSPGPTRVVPRGGTLNSSSANETAKADAVNETNLGSRLAGLFGGRKEDDEAVTVKPLVLAPRVMHFNLMVAGLSGLGKTTAVKALFKAWTQPGQKQHQNGEPHNPPTSHVDTSRVFERFDKKTNTVLRVTIVDTPGFGNNIDHGDAVKPITKYVADCRRRQYEMASSETDPSNRDQLVHACVYFMSPHRFLEIDRFFLKHVQQELPVIPVIAKSDTLTDEELAAYRKHLRHQFHKEKIDTYILDDGNASTGPRAREIPTDCLAIIARDGTYPWGVSRVYDEDHSDFDLLRHALLSEHTEKLIQLARTKYQHYRVKQIRTNRRLALIKSLAILAFSSHALATRTTLFPFIDDVAAGVKDFFQDDDIKADEKKSKDKKKKR